MPYYDEDHFLRDLLPKYEDHDGGAWHGIIDKDLWIKFRNVGSHCWTNAYRLPNQTEWQDIPREKEFFAPKGTEFNYRDETFYYSDETMVKKYYIKHD